MKAIVALSGGMDSATVLGMLLHEGYEVEAISFAYGSKHNQYENRAAKDVAGIYGVPLTHIDISGVMASFESNLLQSGGDIPEGHYTDESMSKTVVPARNIIFLSILAGHAWSVKAEAIGIGVHQGDHAIYPDCRPAFITHMNNAIMSGTDGRVSIVAPFLGTDKEGILRWGVAHGVPYALTRTCYKDQELACGKCGSCVERLEAFTKLGMIDPVRYAHD